MNKLKVIVNIEHKSSQEFCQPVGIIAPPKRLEVRINFELYNPNNELVKRMTIVMEARHNDHGEECLRDELKQSAYADYEVWCTPTGGPDDSGEWTIEIIDPQDFLKWFGIDHAVDIFKQNQKNAKPLRLPAARFD